MSLNYFFHELPEVRWVLPDSYLNVKEKDYGGEPFINGEAVPYDPKYHEEWVRNNARANDRNNHNNTPRRKENVGNKDYQTRPLMPNAGGPPTDQGGFPPNNVRGFPPNNAGGHAYPRPGNMGAPSQQPRWIPS
ncbi:multiple organellar RNA editing factor 8, chloroplastic/mitochondrial-like [Lotus japonicus]|uniref:multiple organellar RNA editing factor 8, chloroplastic/mitochondrial-like n=1 Tax=Lotus japonicus TaxID=34305 RepID=UPI00258DECAC|nr:multiple organellar RNA editing factor 8, chloroplastic/mitochondrial-like [Lotus japonicus]